MLKKTTIQQEKTKQAFVELGKFLAQFQYEKKTKNTDVLYNDLFFDDFINLIENQIHHNGWFTPEQICFSLQEWANVLTQENLNFWLSAYDFSKQKQPKTIGLVLAGNIPLVGFHDFLSVLVCGDKALVKTSSSDKQLLPFLAKYLVKINSELQHKIEFTQEKLSNSDAVIATGSNNTARYFEYYFRNKPSIIRKNRNSIALLTGEETQRDLLNLGKDIFRYFGLGCRNVSKLYVPIGYNFDSFFQAIYPYQNVIDNHKYSNNYDYNKAIFLMSNYSILDNGFLLLKEDSSYSSPISVVFYEYYSNLQEIKNRITQDNERIQCVVSNEMTENTIAFRQTQHPKLWDYADNVDVIAFLLGL